jgi:hypothetical protein
MFRWKNMQKHVDGHINHYDTCHQYNMFGRPHSGLISDIRALYNKNPWEKIQIDCVDPWTVNVAIMGSTGEIVKFTFHTVTIVDCCTN